MTSRLLSYEAIALLEALDAAARAYAPRLRLDAHPWPVVRELRAQGLVDVEGVGDFSRQGPAWTARRRRGPRHFEMRLTGRGRERLERIRDGRRRTMQLR